MAEHVGGEMRRRDMAWGKEHCAISIAGDDAFPRAGGTAIMAMRYLQVSNIYVNH